MLMPLQRRRLSPSRLCVRCVLALAILVVSAGASGCFTARGPEPLDLSVARGKISDDGARLVQIRQVMERDLEQLAVLRNSFESSSQSLYSAPFPLDLFKYVAMSCFNEPFNSRTGSDTPTQAPQNAASDGPKTKKSGPWTCSPEYAERLMVALQQRVPDRQAAAKKQLHDLDQLRQLRAKLLFRLGQLPAILREMRQLLATRRADLRRMRAAEARRRTEYNGSDWEEMERRFEAFEQDLLDLNNQISQLDEVATSWKPVVETQISALYSHLTSLTAPPN